MIVTRISGHYSFSIALFFCLYFLSVDVNGQATGDPQEDFLYGEYYIEQGLYQQALPFYLSSLNENPDNNNINYRVGLCYLKLIGEQQKALPYLEKAVLDVDEHYVKGKYRKPAAPVEAWLLLGDVYLRSNDLLKASYAYHQYKNYVEGSDKQMLEVVLNKINNLGISSEYQRTGQEVRIINMGERINSRFSDYNPVLTGNQATLIYTQLWDTYDNIMISYRTTAGWALPESINEKIGSSGNCYTSALSSDGTELYLITNDDSDYNIYITYFKDGEWTTMIPLPGKVNSRYRESSVCISHDNRFLYFSSDRPGGQGGFDIYRAELQGNEWGNVNNLGDIINTPKNEEAPYLTNDGTLLFFSSNGHETLGNMDILFAERDSTGDWGVPINLGSPVNTTSDDIFYIYYPETKSGYLSRDIAQGYGKNDLYRLQFGEEPYFMFYELPVTSPDFINVETDYSENYSIEEGNKEENDNHTINNSGITLPEWPYGYVPDFSLSLDSIPIYTIQLYALRKKIDPERIKFKPVTISEGGDSLYFYTYGKYKGYSKALTELDSIRKSGFPDAFIKNIATLENYSGYGIK